MSTQAVRISESCHSKLQKLAEERNEAMVAVLEVAVEELRRKHFLKQLNRDFARLRKDSKAWKHELDERSAWDAALGDGLKER
ncbi:MAG TPA: toxin-antitoxin system protein [Terriglobia bacterium]|nr:toxin-antitoxin system protein [Terriglobia bacterium]